MLVSHAHSFRQQARLAVTLAWVAGYTNIITLLVCGTVTSHMSGTTSNLGKDIFSGAWQPTEFAALLLSAFFVGAGISGLCTEIGRQRGWESIFVLPMIIEALLLGTFAVLLELLGPPVSQTYLLEYAMIGLASAAMGLQNATITQISRGQVRTTHVTGVLTDLGQESVQFCCRLFARWRSGGHARSTGEAGDSAGRRLSLLAAIYIVFVLGAGLGTCMHAWQPRYAMLPPVAFLLWIVYQDISKPIAEIQASSVETTGIDLPAALAVFHLRKDSAVQGRTFRIPNLLAWAERLPAETRAVILDVGEIPELNVNAVLELKALVASFEATDRTMVVSGMNQKYAEQMILDAADQWLLEHICPDLDLAIACALNKLNSGSFPC